MATASNFANVLRTSSAAVNRKLVERGLLIPNEDPATKKKQGYFLTPLGEQYGRIADGKDGIKYPVWKDCTIDLIRPPAVDQVGQLLRDLEAKVRKLELRVEQLEMERKAVHVSPTVEKE